MQPFLINRQTNHLDRCKPLGRIRSGFAQGCPFAQSHQNLNVTHLEAWQFRRRRDIQPRRYIFGRPNRQGRVHFCDSHRTGYTHWQRPEAARTTVRYEHIVSKPTVPSAESIGTDAAGNGWVGSCRDNELPPTMRGGYRADVSKTVSVKAVGRPDQMTYPMDQVVYCCA